MLWATGPVRKVCETTKLKRSWISQNERESSVPSMLPRVVWNCQFEIARLDVPSNPACASV